jgi:branched-chain amino acid transport system substrate-binding protein
MITRRSRLALLIVPALALATACTGGGDNSSGSAASGDQTLKIGLLTQLRGRARRPAPRRRTGAKLAVDVINGLNPSIPLPLASDAGLPNLGGAKVSLVVKDVTPVAETTPRARDGPQQGAGAVQKPPATRSPTWCPTRA